MESPIRRLPEDRTDETTEDGTADADQRCKPPGHRHRTGIEPASQNADDQTDMMVQIRPKMPMSALQYVSRAPSARKQDAVEPTDATGEEKIC
jgi:hypothetical protein